MSPTPESEETRVTDAEVGEGHRPEPGKLKPPYPATHCAIEDCRRELTGDVGAYLFRDTTRAETGFLFVLCEGCAAEVELNGPPTLRLVAL